MYKIHLNFLFSEIEIKVGLNSRSLEGTVTLQVVLFGKEILPWRVFLISVKSFAGIQKSVIKYEEFERCMEIDMTAYELIRRLPFLVTGKSKF